MPQVLTSSDGAANSNDAQWTDGVPVPEGTNVGDLLVWTGTEWAQFPAGPNGEVVTSNGPGTLPSYNPAATGTIPSGTVIGDALVWNGANWTLLPAGAAGDAIVSNGPGVLPTYQTVSGTVTDGVAIGDVLVWNGAAWTLLTAGAGGDVIASNGPGTLPTYQTISAPKSGDTVTRFLDFLGQGDTGPTKTTTVVDGATIAEEFSQIGDELYTYFHLDPFVDQTQDVVVQLHFYLDASEVGKLVSFDLAVGASNGLPVNRIFGPNDPLGPSVQAVDVPVGAQWIDTHVFFTLDAATYMGFANQDALSLRFTRVASSDEPTADPRCHLVTVAFVAK